MSAPIAMAGAFLFPEGEGQIIVTTTFADARKAYDARGRVITTPSYRKFETKAYVEHGLHERVTLVAEANYLDFRQSGVADPSNTLSTLIAQAKAGLPLVPPPAPHGPRYSGVGLGAIGARLKLFDFGDYVISFEASLRGGPIADARRYIDMRDPTQIDLRLQIGRPFEILGVPGFLDAQFGWRTRGQVGDELRADVTWGVRPFPRIMVLAQSFLAMTPRAPAATMLAQQKFQVSAVYEAMPRVSLQLGAIIAPTGVNAPAERGVVTGVWWRY